MEDKINRIENWRGVLAILVLFSHSIQLLCSPKMSQHWMISLGPIAHISVLIFFFLSGVVIFSSLEKRFKSQDKLIFIFYKYIRSRFIRIYPPLIGMIIIIIILKIYIKSTFPKLPNEFMFSFNDIINYLFMKDVSLGKINAPLWTLIIEWWLYIIGFISYFILTNKPVYKIIGVLILSILFFGMISKINNNFFVYFTIWMIGAFFYFKKLINFTKILLTFSTCIFIYTFFFKNILFSGIDVSTKPMIQILVILSFIGFIFIFKKNKFLSFISSFSYSIYIIHYPIFIFIKLIWFKIGVSNWSTLLTIDLLTISTSYIFSKIFENKNRFSNIFEKINFKYFFLKNEI